MDSFFVCSRSLSSLSSFILMSQEKRRDIVKKSMECSICMGAIDNEGPTHSLECGHTFHCSCICTWFRQGNGTCPNCRDVGNEDRLSFPDSRARASWLRRRARNKSAPTELKRLVTRVQAAEKRLQDISKEMTNTRRDNSSVFKKWSTLRSRRYAAYRMISKSVRELGTYSSPDFPMPNIQGQFRYYPS